MRKTQEKEFTTTENPIDKKSPLAMIPPNKPINTRKKAPIESNNIRTIFSFFIHLSDIIIYSLEMRTLAAAPTANGIFFIGQNLLLPLYPKFLLDYFHQ